MAVQWQPQQGMKHWDSGTFLAFQKWLKKLLRKQILSPFLASIASADAKNENNKTSCICLGPDNSQEMQSVSVCYGCLLLSYAFKLDFGERIKNIQVAGETWLSYMSLSKLGITNETVLADWRVVDTQHKLLGNVPPDFRGWSGDWKLLVCSDFSSSWVSAVTFLFCFVFLFFYWRNCISTKWVITSWLSMNLRIW